MHCSGHQKGEDPSSRRNNWADATAKDIALQKVAIMLASPPKLAAAILPEFPAYTDQELQRIYTCTNAYKEKAWFKTPDEWIIHPSGFAPQLIWQRHQSTHLGEKKIQDLLRRVHLKVFDLKFKTAEAIG